MGLGGTPVDTIPTNTCLVHLITPDYQRKRFFRPRRSGKVWGAVRRYQLLELLAFSGAIALVWLGAHLDNQRSPWAPPEPAGVESASADLIDGVPVGQRRPL